MKKLALWCVAIIPMLFAAGCGDTLVEGQNTGGGGGGGGGGGDTTTYTMSLATDLATLSAGGSTAVTATIRADGATYTGESVAVAFSSTCMGQAKASLTTPVSTSAGTAVSTYTAQGCVGADLIVASATVDGQTVGASASVTVAAANASVIGFVSATPSNIGIKNVGLQESAVVTFRVADDSDNPVTGSVVNFTLSSTQGGIALTANSGTTNGSGLVSTTVNSGTVSTTVRVTATLASNPAIQTQSEGLVISTGIADQDSFSLAASVLNPEAWSIDGNTVTFTVHAADHFNNPIPNGSAVYFTTEGGQIDSSCLINNGACTVTWRSADPRPADGRATVMAVMQGEESFTDLNGNGRFDDGESFDDLPEAWRDDNENGVFDAGVEEYRDYNNDGSYTPADGLYAGVLCNGPTLCAPTRSVEVRRSLVLVMAGSTADVTISPATFPGSGTITIQDVNGQPMPAGTTVTVTANNGVLQTPGSFVVSSTNVNGPLVYAVNVTPDTTPSFGTLTVKVTAPSGITVYKTADIID